MLERQCSQKCHMVGIMTSILQIEKLNFRVVRNYRHIVILSCWQVNAKPSISFWLYYYASTTLCIPGVILLTLTNLIIEIIINRNQGNVSFSSCHDKPRDINTDGDIFFRFGSGISWTQILNCVFLHTFQDRATYCIGFHIWGTEYESGNLQCKESMYSNG